MRLVTFRGPNGSRAIGALTPGGETLVDLTAVSRRLSAAEAGSFDSMLALVQAGAAGLARARELADEAVQPIPLDNITLLAPLCPPEQIRCFAAFEEHGRRSAAAMMKVMAARAPDPVKAEAELLASGRFTLPKLWYERPLYYKGNRFSVVGHDCEIVWPDYSDVVDYELELGCVIGATGRDIAVHDAPAFIFGYTVCNDLSARDAQAIEMQAPLGPAKGKDFDGGLAMGPCIVTADEFDLGLASMVARINGEEWSRGAAAAMHHSFADMIRYVSRGETLHAGEMFLSGCVGGGSGMELGRYPVRGDVIELEIGGIGVLRNRIV